MVDEISVYHGLKVLKSGLRLDVLPATDKFDMAGTHKYSNVQDVGTAYEALAFGADLGTQGWAHFTNLDVTNYVELGLEVSGAFYPFAKLLAGESAMFPIGGALFAKANTASVKLGVEAIER